MKNGTFVVLSIALSALLATVFLDPPITHAQSGAATAATAPSVTRPAAPTAKPVSAAPAADAVSKAASPDPALVKQYCATCHSERAKTGGLVLEGLDVVNVAPNAETWEHVVRKIRTGMIHVNGAARDMFAPFGGYKQSGNGREWGKEGLKEFLEVKALMGYSAG